MKIFNSFSHLPSTNTSFALTIGNFDGVHLGHQTLLNRLKQVAEHATVITFSNHSNEVLHNTTVCYLTTLSHRLSLFEKCGVDETILIPFSKNFSNQTAERFLIELKRNIPFTQLILGHDAVIGHDRNNDLYDLAARLGFYLEYLEPVAINGKIISSSEIRKCIYAGNLTAASQFLGRPYSIFAEVQRGSGKGGPLGFPTANLTVHELALPPLGVYAVDVKINNEILPAVANLGLAPTLHKNRPPCLEVHLINDHRDLYGKALEVIFLKYLRPEKTFENRTSLITQIQIDIEQTQKMRTQIT